MHDSYSTLLDCDLNSDLITIHDQLNKNADAYERQKSILKPISCTYGQLIPIGNLEAQVEFAAFSGRHLNQPDNVGTGLHLTVQRNPTGLTLGHKVVYKAKGGIKHKVEQLKSWIKGDKKVSNVPKAIMTFSNSRKYPCVIQPCQVDSNSDLYQIGIKKKTKWVKEKAVAKYKTLNFRLSCDRSTHQVKIYAGAFDKNGSLVCHADDMYFEDAFCRPSDVLVWKPHAFDKNGVPTQGRWAELSVNGNAYELRTEFNRPGPRRYEYSFSSTTWNELTDYSLIYSNGICFLWRVNPDPPSPVLSSDEICCPVTLELISTRNLATRICQKTIEKSHLSDVYARVHEKKIREMLSERPWFFSGCGHVFSDFVTELQGEHDVHQCCICRTHGRLVPLTSPDAINISFKQSYYAFDTCGHMVDPKEAFFWSDVVQIPWNSHHSRPKWSKNIVCNPEYLYFYHGCKYCTCKVNATRKLFFTATA